MDELNANATNKPTNACTKTCNRESTLERMVEVLGAGQGRGRGGGLNPLLLTPNLDVNANAVPSYKHVRSSKGPITKPKINVCFIAL